MCGAQNKVTGRQTFHRYPRWTPSIISHELLYLVIPVDLGGRYLPGEE